MVLECKRIYSITSDSVSSSITSKPSFSLRLVAEIVDSCLENRRDLTVLGVVLMVKLCVKSASILVSSGSLSCLKNDLRSMPDAVKSL